MLTVSLVIVPRGEQSKKEPISSGSFFDVFISSSFFVLLDAGDVFDKLFDHRFVIGSVADENLTIIVRIQPARNSPARLSLFQWQDHNGQGQSWLNRFDRTSRPVSHRREGQDSY